MIALQRGPGCVHRLGAESRPRPRSASTAGKLCPAPAFDRLPGCFQSTPSSFPGISTALGPFAAGCGASLCSSRRIRLLSSFICCSPQLPSDRSNPPRPQIPGCSARLLQPPSPNKTATSIRSVRIRASPGLSFPVTPRTFAELFDSSSGYPSAAVRSESAGRRDAAAG